MIVDLHNRISGMVINSNINTTIGYFSRTWIVDMLDDFNGIILLEND